LVFLDILVRYAEIFPVKALRIFLNHSNQKWIAFLERPWHPLKTHFFIFSKEGLNFEKKWKKWSNISFLDLFLTSTALLEQPWEIGFVKAYPSVTFKNSRFFGRYT